MNKSLDKFWSEYYRKGTDFQPASDEAVDFIVSQIKSNIKTCLDIGCGTGQLTRALNGRGFSIVAVDISSEAIKIARSQKSGTVKYIHFDIEKDDLKSLSEQPYALIVCKLVYAFIQDKPKFLTNVKSMLDKSGVFIIATPLIEDVPEFKKGIAVDLKTTQRLLEKSFFVRAKKIDGLMYFVCKHI